MGDTSDYSFLIQSIEGRLAASAGLPSSNVVEHSTPPHKGSDFSLSIIAANTSAKKRRLSDLIMEEADGDDVTSTRDFKLSSQPTRSVSSNLRLQMQVDELKLVNEQLKEQLKSYRGEHELFKDQSSRQLKFLEDLNTRYKSEVEASRQKYYDEKKKWQSRLREAEEGLKKIQSRNDASALDISTTSVARNDSGSREIARRMKEMEAIIATTQEESQRNMSQKIELEGKVVELEQRIRIMQANSGGQEDMTSELRQLRKQYQELETAYRRKSKDAEKYSQQVKNQVMMEEELSSTVTKLNLAQETIKAFHSMEVDHRRLVEDRKTWNQIFHSILEDETSANRLAVEDVNPTKALSLFREVQQKCALLESQHGNLERNATNLRQALLKSEARCMLLEKDKIDAQTKLEKLESKQNVVSQQSRLYESEIASLRTLLQSFDIEFNIGKPDAAKMLVAKDTMVTALRQDLDQSRQQVAQLVQTTLEQKQQLESLTSELTKTKAEVVEAAIVATSKASEEKAVASGEDVLAWQSKYKSLEDDFYALQEVAGVDFLPYKTQVLHFKDNPSAPFFRKEGSGVEVGQESAAAKEAGNALSGYSESSLPTEVVKHYRAQNRALKAKVLELQTAATGSALAQLGSHDHHEGSGHSPNVSLMMSFQQASKPTATVNVVDHAKMNVRLKEAFKEKISSFREAVYLLTGFKAELYAADLGQGKTVNRMKLKSMYAESPDDCLIFQVRIACL